MKSRFIADTARIASADAAVVVAAAAEQAGLVEVDVGVDEAAGSTSLTAEVDLDGLAGKPRRDRGDPARRRCRYRPGTPHLRVAALRKTRSKAGFVIIGEETSGWPSA